MNIGLISDTHLESNSWQDEIDNLLPTNHIDAMLLLGDIAPYWVIVDICIYIQEKIGCHVIFVPGNHDYYSYGINMMEISMIEALWMKEARKNEFVHILINKNIVIGGIDFFGSTWWSGLDESDGLVENYSLFSDFRRIVKKWGIEGDIPLPIRINPHDMREFNAKSIKAFKAWSNKSKASKRVLCTHFPMLECMQNPNFEKSAYFNSQNDDLIKKHKPDYILFGHTHWNIRENVDGIICSSNMYGYSKEVGSIGFEKEFSIKT